VGGTPLYPAPRLGELAGLRKLYLRDDTRTPSASLKDRASAVAIAHALDIVAGEPQLIEPSLKAVRDAVKTDHFPDVDRSSPFI